MGVQQLTNSRLACFRACPRRHYFRYELGVRPVEDTFVLRVGNAFHAALEAYNKGRDPSEILHAAIPDPYDLAIVAAMVDGHQRRWAAEPLEVVATERSFDVALVNPDTGKATPTWRLAGKIDCIVRLPDGRLALQEYKTTSKDFGPGEDYWVRLHLDPQLSLYVYAARQAGYDVETILYDVTRRPGQRPSGVPVVEDGAKVVVDASGTRVRTKDGKKWRETADSTLGYRLVTRPETVEEFAARVAEAIASDPDHHFARIEIARLDQDLDEALRDAWRMQSVVRDCQLAATRLTERGLKPSSAWAKNPDGCMGNGYKCEFLAVCQQRIEIDPARPPDGFVAVEDIHPELASA